MLLFMVSTVFWLSAPLHPVSRTSTHGLSSLSLPAPAGEPLLTGWSARLRTAPRAESPVVSPGAGVGSAEGEADSVAEAVGLGAVVASAAVVLPSLPPVR